MSTSVQREKENHPLEGRTADTDFRRNPSEQRWWRTGEEDIPYSHELPDSVISDNDPEMIAEEDYLGVKDLEHIRVMVEETGINSDRFLERVRESSMHPVHKWQMQQLLEGPAHYAVEPSDYDGAPEPADVEVDPGITESARQEYIESRGVAPGTSIHGYLEGEDDQESLDPHGVMAL